MPPFYDVSSPVKISGEIHKPGCKPLELSEKKAAPAVKSGSLKKIKTKGSGNDNTPPKTDGSNGNAPTDPDKRLDIIIKAIDQIDPNDESAWTQKSGPKLGVLNAQLDWDASSEERDAAWAKINPSQD